VANRNLLLPLITAAALSACSSPTQPPVTQTTTANVVVFYDENGNGLADGPELVRLPNVTVQIGSASGTTAAGSGRATLTAPVGPGTVTADPQTLPPYYRVDAQSVTLPSASEILLPATLAIGSNHPNLYMGFGDSITQFSGYVEDLEGELAAYYGAAQTVNEGLSGTRSIDGTTRINPALMANRPAATLVMYGTNDWNEAQCKNPSRFPCYTITSLRYILNGVKGSGSLPFIATLPPVNVGYNLESPRERNNWNEAMNVLIRNLAVEQNAVLVDVWTAMVAEPDQSSLFLDHIHPNDKGRAIMVKAFKDAITSRNVAATGRRRGFPFGFSF
jgi:lysophospholipase L1-like esterase